MLSYKHNISWYQEMLGQCLRILGIADNNSVYIYSRYGRICCKPSRYQWLVAFIDAIQACTHLDEADCIYLMTKINDNGYHANNGYQLLHHVVMQSEYIDIEPSWHMNRRHDTEKMSREAWQYFGKIYHDKIAIDKLHEIKKHYPQCILDDKRAGRKNLTEHLDAAINASITRIQSTQIQYDVLGNAIMPQNNEVMHENHQNRCSDGLPNTFIDTDM